MGKREPVVQFHRDPLQFLDQKFPAEGDAFWLPGRQLCLAEPVAARAVLTNDQGLYEDRSDFFHIKQGTFGPRAVQMQIARASRELLRAHVDARADELAAAVERELVPVSGWPDAGNWLVYRHLQAALVAPDSPLRLRRIVDEIVERAVLAGARERRSRLSRALFRFRVGRELARAVEERRKRRAWETGPPADLLDVVVGAAGPGALAAELAEVFLSAVFAVAGSIGFVLGWSVYLLGSHPETNAEPGWVVRESLRLWPVAWMLGSRPAQPHEVAGIAVTPDDEVVVCPYLVHRHPQHWDDPAGFRPERWAGVQRQPTAFIPFGWGPHKCPAAALSMELVEDILRILIGGYRLTFTPLETRPCVGPALAPPRFTLGLSQREKGGE
ncbi:MAG TPA: cytochrome P450 [Thermoanaerobaculia bacterium]